MKKRLFSIALCLMLLLSLCVTAHAADGVYLIDEPGLLTRDEAETLESRAAELTGRYGIGVYIAVVDDFTDYAKPRPRRSILLMASASALNRMAFC